MDRISTRSRLAIAASALLLIVVFYVPIWEILMWAPQYPEWLGMKIWLNNITGDVTIINGLNHYIGMKYIKVEMFPEFTYMPYILSGIIAFGVLMSLWGRLYGVWAFLVVLLGAGIAGMVDFWLWGYDYGHNLDPTAAIKVPGMSYQPPLLGTKELLNFIAYSGPDTGGYIMAFSGVVVIAVVVDEIRKRYKKE